MTKTRAEARGEHDRRRMAEALRLAERARGRTSPNPMVGSVVEKGGRVVGRGWHRKAGGPHGEAAALADAGAAARGATVYVTLEPCNHDGRTGPCTEALLAAGVKRVVVGMRDPNPRVKGGGVERLRRAGVEVEVGVLEAECRALNQAWIKLVTTGRPLVTMKAAVTLDGRLAARGGDARWITGEAARRAAHRLRDEHDAILVGAGTVRADDPALTTRIPGGRDALRVILDGRLRVPARAKAVPGAVVFAAKGAPARRDLERRGAEIVRLGGSGARVDLGKMLDALGARGVASVLVEGGGEVHGQLLAAGLVDRVAIFVAPKLIGAGGVPLLAIEGPRRMAEAWHLTDVEVKRIGEDVLVTGRVAR